MDVVMVIYCCITNNPIFSGLKQFVLIVCHSIVGQPFRLSLTGKYFDGFGTSWWYSAAVLAGMTGIAKADLDGIQ